MSREEFTAGKPETEVQGRDGAVGGRGVARRRSTETKAAYKTTELIAFLVAVAGVLIATAVVDQADAGGLGARQGWTLVTALTIGYLVSRGLAKSGSREPYTEHDETRERRFGAPRQATGGRGPAGLSPLHANFEVAVISLFRYPDVRASDAEARGDCGLPESPLRRGPRLTRLSSWTASRGRTPRSPYPGSTP